MKKPAGRIFQQMELGPLQNFLYFIGDDNSKNIAIVDPAWDVNYLRQLSERNGYTITSVLLTHGHPDHVNGLNDLLSSHDVPVYISKHEADFYMPSCNNLSTVEHGEIINIGSITLKCLHTPGHTPGSQCFQHENILIAGDTVFIDGCGRCDLPGGDARVMYKTLYKIILSLPDSTVIYPGHNYGPTPSATLASQKKTNPYLTCQSEEEFLRQRMGIML